MPNTTLSSSRKILFGAISIFLMLFFILIIGEVILRIFPSPVADPVPEPPYNTRLIDDTLGWKVKPNYEFTGTMKDFKNVEYPAHISFDKNGFRNTGLNDSVKRPLTILFLGDSYTESVEVSDDKLFYSLIEDSMPIKAYAYGAAGYGGMQEYLILDKYIREIKPDIVLWQLCTNDYIDNYCTLEKYTNYRVGMRRPYLTLENQVEYDHPWLPHKHLREYSHFLYYLAVKYDAAKEKVTGKPRENVGEKLMYEQDSTYVLFKNSIHATDLIVKKFKERFSGQTRIITYVSDSFDPLYSILKGICVRNNMEFIDGVGAAVQHAQDNGQVVRANDGYHWSELGHQIVASHLTENLRPVVTGMLSDTSLHKK